MNHKEKMIIDYIQRATRGIVRLREQQAAELINIACSNVGARAEIYKYSTMHCKYHLLRTVWFANGKEDELIKIALANPQIEHFYQYQVYDAENNFVTFVYTLNPNLLD